MPIDYTSFTTNQEITDISTAYTTQDALSEAIQTGDTSRFDIEDLIAAYFALYGTLPESIRNPADLGDPNDYPWLWEDAVISTLEQLGDLYGNALDWETVISNFTSFGNVEVSDDILSEVEDFLSGYGLDAETSEDVAEDVYNLFNVNDLSEVMSLFLSMGNPGMALLLYTAYALAPEMRELQDAALDVIEDSSDEMEDILDDLRDLNPDDLSAQYDSQALSQQLNVVATVLQTMTQFLQNAQDVIDTMLQLANDLEEQKFRLDQQIINR